MAILTEILLVLSSLSMIIGAVGLLRFKDIYTRTHAATMITVGGIVLTLVVIALSPFNPEFSVKILLIAVFILFTAPITSHAIVMSAYDHGIRPKGLVKDDLQISPAKSRKAKK